MPRSGTREESSMAVEVHGTELKNVAVSGTYQPAEPDVGIRESYFEDIEIKWDDGSEMPVGLPDAILAENEESIQAELRACA